MTLKRKTLSEAYVPWYSFVSLTLQLDSDQQSNLVLGAFKCLQVRANPSGALSSLVYMCKAIASWHVRISLSFFKT